MKRVTFAAASALLLTAVTGVAVSANAATQCGDVNASGGTNGEIRDVTIGDVGMLIQYLYYYLHTPVTYPDMADVDNVPGLSNNDVMQIAMVVNIRRDPNLLDCTPDPGNSFPVSSDDKIEIHHAYVPPGAATWKVELWVDPSDVYFGLAFPFRYSCPSSPLVLNSIDIAPLGGLGGSGLYKAQEVNQDGSTALIGLVDYQYEVAIPNGKFCLAYLWFSLTPSTEIQHIEIEAVQYNPAGTLVLSRLAGVEPNQYNTGVIPVLVETPSDLDDDGIVDASDNCVLVPNPDQADADGDGVGDVCDDCTDIDADGFGDPGYSANTCTIDNCPWTYNPGQEDAGSDGIGDACTFTQPTPDGSNITVPLGSNISLTFDDVTVAGTTDMTMSASGPGLSGYQIVPSGLPVYYNITTDATYSGDITVCVYYDPAMDPTPAADFTLQHYNGSTWDVIAIAGSNDPILHRICGVTTSLSPFVAAFRTSCCVGRVGDANGIGTYPHEVTISDIQLLVTAKFISSLPCGQNLLCLTEADVNQSGGADPKCSDITISDIQTLVNHLFIAGPANAPLKECL